MTEPRQNRWWKGIRRGFRWFRILLLLLVLGAVLFGIYITQIGFPGFLKEPLLKELRQRGMEVNFSRMRYHWYRGVVVEELRFGPAAGKSGPRLYIEEAELGLDDSQLRHFKARITSLRIQKGRLLWALQPTNQPPRLLRFDGITSQLAFHPGDEWELKNFQARYRDFRIFISGNITNAPHLRDWRFGSMEKESPGLAVETVLARIEDVFDDLKVSGFPDLSIKLAGDALKPEFFQGDLSFRVPAIESPWGKGEQVHMHTLLVAGGKTNALPPLQVQLAMDRFERGDLVVQKPSVDSTLFLSFVQPVVSQLKGHFSVLNASNRWGRAGVTSGDLAVSFFGAGEMHTDFKAFTSSVRATNGLFRSAEVSGSVVHFRTNLIPVSGKISGRVQGVESAEASASSAEFSAELLPRGGAANASDEWGFWKMLEPYPLAWTVRSRGVRTPKLSLEEIFVTGKWSAPRLEINELEARLYGGRATAAAELDVSTRVLTAGGVSEFDAKKILPLLTPGGSNWLNQFNWKAPPHGEARLRVRLPAWTNREPDWRKEVLPTLAMEGLFQARECGYQSIEFLSAESHFNFTNLTWSLPDLHAVRPEGGLQAELTSNDQTKDYHVRLHSQIDPKALEPVLESRVVTRIFHDLELSAPPDATLELWGRWHEPEQMGVEGTVKASRLKFRGEAVEEASAGIHYTNSVLRLDQPKVKRAEQWGRAPKVEIDFDRREVRIDHAEAEWDPPSFTHMIGPEAENAIKPYAFAMPPRVLANGVVSFSGIKGTHLTFHVKGNDFSTWRIHAKELEGDIDWTESFLRLTNVVGNAYDGKLTGWAEFDFSRPEPGADFRLDGRLQAAQFYPLMTDLLKKTNDLSGVFSGHLALTSGSTSDPRTWKGDGRVSLKNGFIWDIPIFGFLSSPLNAIFPGVGKSKAEEGKARFEIAKGQVRSDDLEVRSPLVRLKYSGTVDMDQKVDARVEAEIMKDVPVVGPIFSLVAMPFTKALEYQVTGTLSDPKPKPVYIAVRVLLSPFRIIGGIKDIFTPGKKQEPR